MHTERYPYPLCIQLAAPESLDSPEFLDTLKLLKDSGFYGVEMNLLDFSQAYAVRLKETLERFGLRLTMIASGAFANRNGLSLSSPDQGVRARSVQALGGMLDCAAGFGAGVICGFIKGGPSGDKAVASQQLRASLEELDRLGKTAAAPLYLEATNHYEALLVNTL
ncbi:sugar phosphate isomerase/epimerase family protein, partial [Enterocloster asparagiformis]